MENLNAEQVKEALECCHTPVASDCNKCGYRGRSVENGEYIGCTNRLIKDALALITSQEQEIATLHASCTELTRVQEENERLKNRITCQVVLPDEKLEEIKTKCLERIELDIKAIQAGAIKKMQERLKAKVNADINRCYALGFGVVGPLSLFLDEIDEIAKELLEDGQ